MKKSTRLVNWLHFHLPEWLLIREVEPKNGFRCWVQRGWWKWLIAWVPPEDGKITVKWNTDVSAKQATEKEPQGL